MLFDPYHIQLPVTDIIDRVKQNLIDNNTLLIGAPPGAGKSTLLPLALLNEKWLTNKKIIMLEPRRLAAKSIANRMAELLGEKIGETIGYRIRFENCISNKTRLEVVTEGILTRMLQNDNALEQVALVIFDEFHERNLQADLALAICRESQMVLRNDLRIMIMSATLNMPQLQSKLNAPLIESKGKQYPVEIIYTSDADEFLIPQLITQTVNRAVKQHEGDVLVFLPGEADIKKCEDLLRLQQPEFKIHPLYGKLPYSEQHLAIMPNKHGKRKIVLATSIAETSLTIEGIKIVIDSGFRKTSRFDTASGLTRLETTRISKDSADQRAGRAGRLCPGVCYRLWTKATHERMADHRTPEVQESDLCSTILELAKWGTNNIYELTWLTPPPVTSTKRAYDTLNQIGAIENNIITEQGKQIHQLTCHPRIAHMLLQAQTTEQKQLGCDIAAVLEERDPLPRESGIDINLRIEALRRARSNQMIGNKFKRIEKNSSYYRKLLNLEVNNNFYDVYETGLLLAYAYPERIACARPGNNAQFQMANGKYAMMNHQDDLANEPWLAVASMDLMDGLGKIYLAAPLNPVDLKNMVKEKETIKWDSRKGGLVASKDLCIGSIILKSTPLQVNDAEQISDAIIDVIKTESESLLNLDDNFYQLQNRIQSLGIWNPEQNWPSVSYDLLISKLKDWLGPYLRNIKKNEELKQLNLADCLYNWLSWDQQQLLNDLAPAKIEVPSGSKIKPEYFANGASPILAVRLQEVFGLAETPTINEGKTKLVLHLLSPGYKPVQITGDLKSFWNNLYHDVKKELKRRYPKHAWPDNPWIAKPVAKGISNRQKP